jgi:hypothetical protein
MDENPNNNTISNGCYGSYNTSIKHTIGKPKTWNNATVSSIDDVELLQVKLGSPKYQEMASLPTETLMSSLKTPWLCNWGSRPSS